MGKITDAITDKQRLDFIAKMKTDVTHTRTSGWACYSAYLDGGNCSDPRAAIDAAIRADKKQTSYAKGD